MKSMDGGWRLARRLAPLVLLVLLAFAYAMAQRTPAGRHWVAGMRQQVSERWQQTGRNFTLGASQQPEEAFVPTTTVRKGSFDVSLVTVGALKSEQSQTVVVDAFGTVVWTVEDGSRVKKGDPILQLQSDQQVRQLKERETALVNAKQKVEDTRRDRTLEWQNSQTQHQKGLQELEILKAQNKSQIEQAQAQLEFQKTDLALARVQYAKDARLAEEKLVPLTQVEAAAATVKSKEFSFNKAEGELELKKGQLASTELQKEQDVQRLKFAVDMAKGRIDSEVQNAKMNVDTTKKQRDDLIDQLKKSVVVAPADGIVVLANRPDDGQIRPIRPGDQLGRNQKVCELPDLSKMQVALEVEQKDIAPVRVGLPVRIRLDPFPERVYHGTVTEVASVAKASQVEGAWFDANKNTFATVIDIKESDPARLRPGMSATLEIYSAHLENVTYIPLEALFHEDGRPIAYLEQGGRFRKVPLTLGQRNKDKVMIRKGLRPNQRIALVPPPAALLQAPDARRQTPVVERQAPDGKRQAPVGG